METTAAQSLTDVDLLSVFEKAQRREFTSETIHPVLAEKRRENPVYDGDLFLERFTPSLAIPGEKTVTVLGYDACVTVLRDSETFSSGYYLQTLGKTHGHNILMLDGHEHRRHRRILREIFSRKELGPLREKLIDPIVRDEYILPMSKGRSTANLVRDFFVSYPVEVLHRILDLPADMLDDFNRFGMGTLLISTGHVELAMACSQALSELLIPIISERRSNPRDDAISLMLELSDEEILNTLRVLLAAGAETTMRTSGNLMTGLLTHPDQFDLLKADRTLIASAIEESLRWEGPIPEVHRLAMKDTELAGITIPKGTHVRVVVMAANRDETEFTDPERFDITRRPNPHLGFGHGSHLCLGMNLARAEITSMLDAILDRMPRLRLDDDYESPVIAGASFRSPPELHVRWD
ncbi:MAG TPA: cytochrome P450 [Deltaproteobacteria bacterium]|nr:cytochrome P450 [Deltaproteobacteria bacterium]